MKFVYLIILLLFGCTSSEVGKIPRQAPFLYFYDAEGEVFTISKPSQTTILVFFAEWCSASKRLIRGLNDFVANNPNSKSKLLLVSIDKENDFDRVKNLLAENKLDHLQLAFSGNGTMDQSYIALDGSVIPSIYVLDKNGMIVDGGHSLDVIKKHW